MTKTQYDNPFISPETPTMADILQKIEQHSELSPTKRRDLKSAIRSFCRLIEKDPANVPANINWLHIRIRRVAPASHNVTKKRVANIKSDVLKALELTGCSRARADWLRTPSNAWADLLARIESKHDQWKLTQLAQFCSAQSIEPQQISNDHVLGFLETLMTQTFADKPHLTANNAVKTWNRFAKELDDWPNIELASPPPQRQPWTIPLDQFPQSFQLDAEKWYERLSNPDPLSSDGPLKPLRPETIQHRRHQLQQMASALVKTGLSIEDITSLSVITEIANFKAGIRYLMSRFDNKPTEAIHGLAMGITAIATHHVKVDEPHEKELRAICKRLNLEVDGLREKNRKRLSQFDDSANLAKLLLLPEALPRKAARLVGKPRRAALLVQAAIAIEILLYAPMRVNNLASLNLEEHIRFIGKGRARKALIHIPSGEVKNDRDLNYELSAQSTALLDLYLKEWRPMLLVEPSVFVFPAQNGTAKRKGSLSTLIRDTIRDHTGLTVNAHLFRSIAMKIHSMQAPGDHATISHVLHNRLETTMKAYAQFEQASSIRHYQHSVDTARKRLTRGQGR